MLARCLGLMTLPFTIPARRQHILGITPVSIPFGSAPPCARHRHQSHVTPQMVQPGRPGAHHGYRGRVCGSAGTRRGGDDPRTRAAQCGASAHHHDGGESRETGGAPVAIGALGDRMDCASPRTGPRLILLKVGCATRGTCLCARGGCSPWGDATSAVSLSKPAGLEATRRRPFPSP